MVVGCYKKVPTAIINQHSIDYNIPSTNFYIIYVKHDAMKTFFSKRKYCFFQIKL